MTGTERPDAFALLRPFRSDERALGEALALFLDRPDFGFVWMAYDEAEALGLVSVAFGIDTTTGALVATLRDLVVAPARRRRGTARELVATLRERLAALEVARLEAAAPDDAPDARAFLTALGFTPAGTAATAAVR